MKSSDLGALVFIAAIILICVLAYLVGQNIYKKRKTQAIALREAYDKALRSGDKQAALKAGREYYSFLRGGKLSVYDEQAITNDLSAMK